MYQLREWQGARSSPTLTGTRQLQENTVCQLKGMASPFSQLPSAARTGWRCTLLNPAGTGKERIHHHLSLLVSSSSILQSSSRHDLAPRAQSLLQKLQFCSRAGTLVQHSLRTPAPSSLFHTICSFYEPELRTPSLQLSPAALSAADEEDCIRPWKILIQDISKWLCLSQWMEAVCNFKAVLQNRLQVDGLIKFLRLYLVWILSFHKAKANISPGYENFLWIFCNIHAE